jgi:putative ubiquitin-RnfH superfamily antitoxin RatB of RatAB toxin-antitoxin module
MVEVKMIHVQVCYATKEKVCKLDLQVAEQSDIFQVIRQSRILENFPEIDLDRNRIGIFGKLKTISDMVREGDRVEIYRALSADPMEARRRRARKKRS